MMLLTHLIHEDHVKSVCCDCDIFTFGRKFVLVKQVLRHDCSINYNRMTCSVSFQTNCFHIHHQSLATDQPCAIVSHKLRETITRLVFEHSWDRNVTLPGRPTQASYNKPENWVHRNCIGLEKVKKPPIEINNLHFYQPHSTGLVPLGSILLQSYETRVTERLRAL